MDRWFLRCQELVDKYQPDLLYFDDTELPLGQAGLDIAAHFYNANIAQSRTARGRADVEGYQARSCRYVGAGHRAGRADGILPDAWQTDTCIGDWHYGVHLRAAQLQDADAVIQMLIDIVSKNGNLLLNIPLRGDGTIDEDERRP